MSTSKKQLSALRSIHLSTESPRWSTSVPNLCISPRILPKKQVVNNRHDCPPTKTRSSSRVLFSKSDDLQQRLDAFRDRLYPPDLTLISRMKNLSMVLLGLHHSLMFVSARKTHSLDVEILCLLSLTIVLQVCHLSLVYIHRAQRRTSRHSLQKTSSVSTLVQPCTIYLNTEYDTT